MSQSANEKRVEASLRRLAKKIGSDVLSLPIHYFNGPRNPPAYTNAEGIFIHNWILRNDPDNVEVYIAHEIFHHVVREDETYAGLSSLAINYAEDYAINNYIYDLYGYDVRRVALKGIFHRKFKGKSPRFIAEAITKKQQPTEQPCCCFGTVHPQILKIAERLKKVNSINIYRDMFFVDAVDKKSYHDIESSQITSLKFDFIQTEASRITENLWYTATMPSAKIAVPPKTKLDKAEAIVYSVPKKLFDSCGTDVDAIIARMHVFYHNMNFDANWLTMYAVYLRDKIKETNIKIKETTNLLQYHPRRRSLKKALVFYSEKLANYQHRYNNRRLQPIQHYLNKERLYISSAMKRSAVSLKSSYAVDYSRPVPKGGLSPALIKSIAMRRSKRFEKALDKIKSLEEIFGEDLNKSVVDEGKKEDEVDDNEAKQEGKGSGSLEPDGESDDDTTLELPTDTNNKPAPGDGPAGKEKGSKHNRVNLIKMTMDKKVVLSIFKHAEDFSSQIKSKVSRNKRGNSGVDQLLSYGNTIENAVPSEMVFLAKEQLKLSFFAKLAQHEILITTPTDKSRTPLVICIDGSGSMQGKPYEIASGFAIAMMALFKKEKRDFALIVFSCSVTGVYVQKHDKPINMMAMLSVVMSPAFGGTNFLEALNAAYAIKDKEKWKTFTVQFITDGYDHVDLPELERLRARKERESDVINSVIVRASSAHLAKDHSLALLSNSVKYTKRNGVKLDLVDSGNAI